MLNQKSSEYKPPKSRFIFNINMKAIPQKRAVWYPVMVVENSKHKLKTCIMFGPKPSVFTVVKKKKIQARTIHIQNPAAQPGALSLNCTRICLIRKL